MYQAVSAQWMAPKSSVEFVPIYRPAARMGSVQAKRWNVFSKENGRSLFRIDSDVAEKGAE